MEGWGADGGEGKPVKVNYRNPFLLGIWSGRGARPPYWVKRIMTREAGRWANSNSLANTTLEVRKLP